MGRTLGISLGLEQLIKKNCFVSAFNHIEDDNRSVPNREKMFIPGNKSPMDRVE